MEKLKLYDEKFPYVSFVWLAINFIFWYIFNINYILFFLVILHKYYLMLFKIYFLKMYFFFRGKDFYGVLRLHNKIKLYALTLKYKYSKMNFFLILVIMVSFKVSIIFFFFFKSCFFFSFKIHPVSLDSLVLKRFGCQKIILTSQGEIKRINYIRSLISEYNLSLKESGIFFPRDYVYVDKDFNVIR